MIALIQFRVDVRRRRDVIALAGVLEELFRKHTVGDLDLDRVSVTEHKRGGLIAFSATIDDEHINILKRMRALAAEIDNNQNLIDRIDEFLIGASENMKNVGFSRGDYRGWMREGAIEDARARA